MDYNDPNYWHKYCERWTAFDASQADYIVMGDPIQVGEWYYSDGYVTRCEDQHNGAHDD